MHKLYNTDNNRFIAYNIHKSIKKNAPSVVFLHGLMSSMEGNKALFYMNYCKQHDYNVVIFDNYGHGKSSGNFLEETMGSWLDGLEFVLNKLVKQPVILIGSSMGAWLAILAALRVPEKISGLMCLAPAVDFTERLIWQKLNELEKKRMQEEKWIEVRGSDCQDKYPISYQLIDEARGHLVLNTSSITLDKPVHLIHGMLDKDVPYTLSTQLAEKISSSAVVVKIIKDGDHRLARKSDFAIMANSLEELIIYTGTKNNMTL